MKVEGRMKRKEKKKKRKEGKEKIAKKIKDSEGV